MTERQEGSSATPSQTQIDLSDDDIRAAMAEIPGYLDISMGDFREIYQQAFRHALERLSGRTTAGQMMLPATWAVRGDMLLDRVVAGMAARALKGLPAVDDAYRVVGVLVLLSAAVVFNNIPRTRRYPEVWF
jgi:CBS domain-containing membrane protein